MPFGCVRQRPHKPLAMFATLLQYEREAALKDFSAGNVRVLIATDVASRGLDVKGIGHVINMDLPRAFEDYVHRIGACQRSVHIYLYNLHRRNSGVGRCNDDAFNI